MLTRRHLLRYLGTLPLAKLACTKQTGTVIPDSKQFQDAGSDLCGPSAQAWAVGGTAAMTAKQCYPDPFAAGVTTCPLICATTAGPCTAPTTQRQDVSDGVVGLPVRLALKIVSASSCQPVAGAVVEIWHTQRSGVYSGATPSPGFCSGGDADAPSRTYFRGTQTTDAAGRVDFDTCYPGWYPGRCIHIHIRVSVGASSFIVTQLFFADGVTQEIFAAHRDYTGFGQPDTSNNTDGIFSGTANAQAYILDTARMSDGAMLASKVIGIRSSLGEPSCSL